MTSKECLKHLIEELALNQANAQIIMGMPSKDEMEINKICYQQVLKDLEILEILKTNMKKNDWMKLDIEKKISYVCWNFCIENEEDFNKVKQWVEGETDG